MGSTAADQTFSLPVAFNPSAVLPNFLDNQESYSVVIYLVQKVSKHPSFQGHKIFQLSPEALNSLTRRVKAWHLPLGSHITGNPKWFHSLS